MRGPRTPEGIRAVTETIRRVNAEGRNVRRTPNKRHRKTKAQAGLHEQASPGQRDPTNP